MSCSSCNVRGTVRSLASPTNCLRGPRFDTESRLSDSDVKDRFPDVNNQYLIDTHHSVNIPMKIVALEYHLILVIDMCHSVREFNVQRKTPEA